MIWRTIRIRLQSRWGPRLGVFDVARTQFRVLPTDQDVIRHMNNGVYLSIMDLGRFDLWCRSGFWARLIQLRYYPVIVSETISFRKSLEPWRRFTVQSRLIGRDEKTMYYEQRFVVGSDVHAVGFVRLRLLKKQGGSVTPAETAELLGSEGAESASHALPAWLIQWANAAALPPRHVDITSSWSEQ